MNLTEFARVSTSVWVLMSLAHVLWQGTLIAVLAGVLGVALKVASAHTRYLVYCTALGLTFACVPLNLWCLRASSGTPTADATPTERARAETAITVQPQTGLTVSPKATVADSMSDPETLRPSVPSDSRPNESGAGTRYWEQYADALLAAYVLGIVAMIGRLFLGLAMCQRLRAGSQPVCSTSVAAVMQRATEELGLRVVPAVAYCSRVTGPVVVGVLKPTILVPTAILSQLSPAMVESLLLHELAHIRRYDYLVNLAQRIVEAVLFFHPGVWWLSRRASTEREFCCDDLAIRWGSNPCDYAESLVRTSELRCQAGSFAISEATALAASGNRLSQLRGRVLRVLEMPTPGPSIGLTRLGVGALLLVVLASAIPLAAMFDSDDGAQEELPSLSAHASRQIEAWATEVKTGTLSAQEFMERLKRAGPQSVRGLIPLMKPGATDALAMKGIEQFIDETPVVDHLVHVLRELHDESEHLRPNTAHCCLLLLGKSHRQEYAGLIASFLSRNGITAIGALSELGGDEARDHLIRAFDVVPTERWWLLAESLGRLGDPAAVQELTRRLSMVELPPNERFPNRTVHAFTEAINRLSGTKDMPLVEWAQGIRFAYPYDGPGMPKSFSVNPPQDHYIRLPKVDPNTTDGRNAIWQTISEQTNGPGFTIDGDRIVTFYGLRVVPLWQDGSPYPTTLYDWFDSVSHRVLLERVRQDGQGGRMVIPENGLLLAMDPHERLYAIRLTRTGPDYQFRVSLKTLDPLRQLAKSSPNDGSSFRPWSFCTLHDLESGAKDGALNLNRAHMCTLDETLWREPGKNALLTVEFAANKIGLAVPGADEFLLTKANSDQLAEVLIQQLATAWREGVSIPGHEVLAEERAIFHTFANLKPGRCFGFAARMPDGEPVAGLLEVSEVDLAAETVKIRHRFLTTDAANQVFAATNLPDGIYRVRPTESKEQGVAVTRSDADGTVVLLGLMTDRFGNASVMSMANDNACYRIDFASAGPFKEGDDIGRMALMIDGLCVMVSSHTDPDQDSCMDLSASVVSKEAGLRIATRLGVTPRQREHPGHRMDVRFSPTKPAFQPGEPVVLKMEIKNVGDRPFHFLDGGRQRGPRNNQFGFAAYRDGGAGAEVPDTGDATNFGGIAAFKTLESGQVFEKQVDITKWFDLSTPDTYKIDARFEMEIYSDENFSYPPAWDEVAQGSTLVVVVATKSPETDAITSKQILPILQTLKQEVVKLAEQHPQLAGAKAIEAKPDEWLFEYDCRYMGMRGYRETGPLPIAIGLRVMTAKQFHEQLDAVAMPYPSYQWHYLGLVGWPTLHVGEQVPSALVNELQETLHRAIAQIGPLNRQALEAGLPEAIRTERERLLAEADATIRRGIQALAVRFPLIEKGQPWNDLKTASPAGRIGIYLRRQQAGKGRTDKQDFPPSEAFSILVILKPPPDFIEQLVLTTKYTTLGLVGQIHTGAADPELGAELEKLVSNSLAPLAELEQRAKQLSDSAAN